MDCMGTVKKRVIVNITRLVFGFTPQQAQYELFVLDKH